MGIRIGSNVRVQLPHGRSVEMHPVKFRVRAAVCSVYMWMLHINQQNIPRSYNIAVIGNR